MQILLHDNCQTSLRKHDPGSVGFISFATLYLNGFNVTKKQYERQTCHGDLVHACNVQMEYFGQQMEKIASVLSAFHRELTPQSGIKEVHWNQGLVRNGWLIEQQSMRFAFFICPFQTPCIGITQFKMGPCIALEKYRANCNGKLCFKGWHLISNKECQ